MNRTRSNQPLLKIHGCVDTKDYTLWCRSQLSDPPTNDANEELKRRLERSKDWLRANLLEKDLLFIGFWTDWSYLTEIVADSFISVHCPLVVLVDPAATGVLQAKAPGLWNWAHSSGVDFVHVPEYGEPFLECLRTEYSKTLLAQVLRSAESSFHAVAPGQPIPSQTFDAAHVDDLYQLRRDFAGVAFNRAPKLPNKADMVGVGRIHLRLRAKGCRLDGSSYVTTENQRIRVVNGKTDVLSDVQARHRDEPNKPIEDKYVICPGAFDAGGAASNIARPQKAASIVRPGGSGEWITEEAAYEKGLI